MNRSLVFARDITGIVVAGALICYGDDVPVRRVKLPLQGSTAVRTTELNQLHVSAGIQPAIPLTAPGFMRVFPNLASAVSHGAPPVSNSLFQNTLSEAMNRASTEPAVTRIAPVPKHTASGETGAFQPPDVTSSLTHGERFVPAAPRPQPSVPPATKLKSRSSSESKAP